MKKALVIFSGGQDSTTCLFWAMKNFDLVEAITFTYGQKHSVEVNCSQEICLKKDVKQTIVDISFIVKLNDSAMLHRGDTSQTKNGLPTSFVPNRNALMITLAHMYAQKSGCTHLVTGVCQTDYSGYPDCRQGFIDCIEVALNVGSESSILILTPLMEKTKAETWQMAEDLNCIFDVIELSHTCYEGDRNRRHQWGYGCGVCPACLLRKKGWEDYRKSRTGVSL
jgi:7-cyano-7-deazaguanine synthase